MLFEFLVVLFAVIGVVLTTAAICVKTKGAVQEWAFKRLRIRCRSTAPYMITVYREPNNNKYAHIGSIKSYVPIEIGDKILIEEPYFRGKVVKILDRALSEGFSYVPILYISVYAKEEKR